jgi:hypothetical protein
MTYGFHIFYIFLLSDTVVYRFGFVLYYTYDHYDHSSRKNFGIELSSQRVPPQVLSSIYNVSQLSSRWISVVPLNTLKTPKQK